MNDLDHGCRYTCSGWQQGYERGEAEVIRLRAVLELIAAPKRPDGTYNRSREACEELARGILAPSIYKQCIKEGCLGVGNPQMCDLCALRVVIGARGEKIENFRSALLEISEFKLYPGCAESMQGIAREALRGSGGSINEPEKEIQASVAMTNDADKNGWGSRPCHPESAKSPDSVSISKGSIIHIDGMWFVIVEQRGEDLCCICDHANNIYSHRIKDCKYIASPYEAMRAHNWGDGPDALLELRMERSIPAEVIAEVLAGCHNDRFYHWRGEP